MTLAFHSTITVGSALAGTVITDVAQLGDICLTMEHSFMGDLFISVECSNGQSEVSIEQNSGVLITQPGLGSYSWTHNGVLIDGADGPVL